MKHKSPSASAFFHLRLLLGLFMVLAGLFLALLGFGTFSAQAQPNQASPTDPPNSPLVPPLFDCSRIHELGIDVQENLRAGAILIYCGVAKGGEPDPDRGVQPLVQQI